MNRDDGKTRAMSWGMLTIGGEPAPIDHHKTHGLHWLADRRLRGFDAFRSRFHRACRLLLGFARSRGHAPRRRQLNLILPRGRAAAIFNLYAPYSRAPALPKHVTCQAANASEHYQRLSCRVGFNTERLNERRAQINGKAFQRA